MDTEDAEKETLAEELSEQVNTTDTSSIPQPHPESAEGSSAREHLAQMGMSPGYYTVVLNRLKLDDDDDDDDDDDGEKEEKAKKEDGEKDEIRKAGKHAASRIPTFQSSVARKRPTGPGPESSMPPPASSLPVQARGKGSGSGSSSRVKGHGTRETALPLPLARLPIGSTDALPHTGTIPLDVPLPSHKRSHSPSHMTAGQSIASVSDPEESHPIVISIRPALRMEAGAHDPNLSEAAENHTIQTDISVTPRQNEQVEEEETGLETQEETGTDSSTVAFLEEQISTEERGPKAEVSEEVESGEEMVHPVVEIEEMGEHNKESMFESDVKEDESKPKFRGADAKFLGLKDGEKETKEPLGESGYDKTVFSSRVVADGGDAGVKSTRDKVAYEKPSRRRQVLKSEVGKATVLSDQPAHLSLAKTQPPVKSGWRCCPFFFLLSMLLLVGGCGLHLWCYGTPASVSDLLEQLELSSLEGLWGAREPCTSDCSFALVESLPEGLEFPTGSPILPPISQTWAQMLNQANSTVSIAAFYLTLRASDLNLTEKSALQGEQIFDQLMKLESRGVKLQIAVNGPESCPQDTKELNATGAEVRRVNLQFLTGGIIHTKLWVVDNKHVYLGSANMDWRSLTQVKELGVSVGNCSCLAQDLSRVFGVYWYVGSQERGSLPLYWPARYSALSSSDRPLHVKLNNVPARVYLSSAPPQLSAQGRTDDLSAILSVISDAQKFIFISVMDYLPFSEFTNPPRFWPAIDSALRAAACARGVEVNMLVSCWPHSSRSMFIFLQSLLILNQPPLSCNIGVKVFEVTSTEEQKQIPFARVNHAKYMVTDRAAYIGTSNWSANYFTQTAGVGLVVNQTGIDVGEGQQTVQSQLQEVFQRDWKSEYARELSHDDVERCGKHKAT
ncbi:uncharacterized protein pld7 isoform X2 [Megalops cyprinoides]|uniref:uncharacterized protein pld7 isoform X2 n=1 Tax=Megalops cyprinoides TaxID=118141 RepID=UPI001864C74E|nr:uncharacterized protein pld7 isoform X2 [Megalops cyprinoides]